MIKSKFKIKYILINIFLFVCSLGILRMLVLVIQDLLNNKLEPIWGLLALFLVILILVVFMIMRDLKYISIEKSERKLIWHSLLNPFGKSIYLNDYCGIVVRKVYSANGITRRIYLVDKTNTTRFGIDELVYSNFEEIKTSLELKEIRNKNKGVINYFKLLFLGRVKVNS